MCKEKCKFESSEIHLFDRKEKSKFESSEIHLFDRSDSIGVMNLIVGVVVA